MTLSTRARQLLARMLNSSSIEFPEQFGMNELRNRRLVAPGAPRHFKLTSLGKLTAQQTGADQTTPENTDSQPEMQVGIQMAGNTNPSDLELKVQ